LQTFWLDLKCSKVVFTDVLGVYCILSWRQAWRNAYTRGGFLQVPGLALCASAVYWCEEGI